jgi:hypothetical protein
VVRKALRTAVAERPGAVHLTVTADAWALPAWTRPAGTGPAGTGPAGTGLAAAGRADGRLNPSDVVAIAREAAPADAIVTTDVGSHKIMAGQVWSATQPRSVLMTNGLSAMGFGVPAAIAARLSRPDRPVIALVGDGGFATTATELRIAAELGLPRHRGGVRRRQPEPDRAAPAAHGLPADRDPAGRHRPAGPGRGDGLACVPIPRPRWRRRWPPVRLVPARWSSRPASTPRSMKSSSDGPLDSRG